MASAHLHGYLQQRGGQAERCNRQSESADRHSPVVAVLGVAAIASAAATTMPATAMPVTRHDPIRSAIELSTIRPTNIATQ
jgi:hypothetical protein